MFCLFDYWQKSICWAHFQALDSQKFWDQENIFNQKQHTALELSVQTLMDDFNSLLRKKSFLFFVLNTRFETFSELSDNRNSNVWVWKTKNVQSTTFLEDDNFISEHDRSYRTCFYEVYWVSKLRQIKLLATVWCPLIISNFNQRLK